MSEINLFITPEQIKKLVEAIKTTDQGELLANKYVEILQNLWLERFFVPLAEILFDSTLTAETKVSRIQKLEFIPKKEEKP